MIEYKNKNVLIIAPHMDDEVIGCSGTILKIRNRISKLVVVHMSDDEIRIKEFENVKRILNIDKHYRFGLQDGFLNMSYKETVIKLIKIIQAEKINIIFIPHFADNHLDHRVTHKMAMDAIGKARYWKTQYNVCRVQDRLEYEVWSFQENVSICVDISEFIELKKQMMLSYESQLDFDYVKYVEYCNGYRGLLFNKGGFTECFNLKQI